MTEEQMLEIWILMMWSESFYLSDDIVKWLAESYPKYFSIIDNVFMLNKFKSSFTVP